MKFTLKVTSESNPATIGLRAKLTIVFWPHPQEHWTFEGYVKLILCYVLLYSITIQRCLLWILLESSFDYQELKWLPRALLGGLHLQIRPDMYMCMYVSFIAKIDYICTTLILNFHVQSHWFLDYLSAKTLYATYKKYLADQITVCCQEPFSQIQTVFWWGKVWGSSAYPGNCPEFFSTYVWILIIWILFLWYSVLSFRSLSHKYEL